MQYQPVRFYKKAILDAELLRNHPQIDVCTVDIAKKIKGREPARSERQQPDSYLDAKGWPHKSWF